MAGSKPRRQEVLIAALIVAICAGLTGIVLWLSADSESGEAAPPATTSADLDDAPLGCAAFDDDEVAPYVFDRFEAVDQGSFAGSTLNEATCRWQDPDDSTRLSERIPHLQRKLEELAAIAIGKVGN